MQILLLPFYIFLIYAFGSIINSKIFEDKKSLNLSDSALNLATGFGAHILLAHLFSFFTQSFNLSVYLVLGLMLICSLILRNRIPKICLEKFEGWFSLGALIFGFFFSMRDSHFGNPDNFHLIYTASIAENNIYPPIFPNGSEMDMSNYHYGVDLIGAAFKTMFALDLWDAHSLQIFFDVSLCLICLYALIKVFLRNNLVAIFIATCASLYTSINAIEFFFREFSNLSKQGLDIFLRNWLVVSWTAVSHFSSQMRLPSQNCAFFFAFVLLILLIKYYKNRSIWFLPGILISAWGLYSSFPAFFYPIVAAYGIFLLYQAHIEFWQEKKFFGPKSRALIFAILTCYIAKVLTFTSSNVNSEALKVLVIDPDFSWVHWGKSYLRYFFSLDYLRTLDLGIDYVYPSWHPQIPLFSAITFREFGFSGLIGFFILLDQVRKKQINQSCILWLSGVIAMMVPMLISFIPREVETTRFLHWTKIAFVIFVCINAVPYIQKFFEVFDSNKTIQKITQTGFYIFLLILMLPGFVSILPAKAFVLNPNNGVDASTKAFLRDLSKVHKTGEICLDNVQFKHGHTITEMAGFYGVGGQMYKSDDATRRNALYLMNPFLLQELEVDYVFVNKDSQISQKGFARLKDSNLFEPLEEIIKKHPKFAVLKFTAQESSFSEAQKAAFQEEYSWKLACHDGKKLNIITKEDGSEYSFDKRAEAQAELPKLKAKLAKENKVACAFWLKEQVVLSGSL